MIQSGRWVRGAYQDQGLPNELQEGLAGEARAAEVPGEERHQRVGPELLAAYALLLHVHEDRWVVQLDQPLRDVHDYHHALPVRVLLEVEEVLLSHTIHYKGFRKSD